jgi:hypothetical protein
MSLRTIASMFVLVAGVAMTGCPPNTAVPVPPSLGGPQGPPLVRDRDREAREPVTVAVDAGSTTSSLGDVGDACGHASDCASGVCEGLGCGEVKLSDGAVCFDSSECGSGMCEGLGCGTAEPGRCAAMDRMCSKDLQRYCGCDGVTFRSSGTCPARRYQNKGSCE